MLRVFIGYDSYEIVAYHTCVQSLLDNVTSPVEIIPIRLDHLKGIYEKQRDETQSTEFSMTRFLTPFLSRYDGVSLFVDCDTIFKADPHELTAYPIAYPDKAVFVVKHDYTPSSTVKFLNQVQLKYEKKNWSSVMLFNNDKCKALTPEYINKASGLELHQFKWLESDDLIGDLPVEWNHLVGEYMSNKDAKIVHFTRGTPCFSEWDEQEYADEWFDVMKKATSAKEASFEVMQKMKTTIENWVI
tara:strand:+ start:824 stop:1555 length:732 start_codon:yes stop_codon:yes gene_type:complete